MLRAMRASSGAGLGGDAASSTENGELDVRAVGGVEAADANAI